MSNVFVVFMEFEVILITQASFSIGLKNRLHPPIKIMNREGKDCRRTCSCEGEPDRTQLTARSDFCETIFEPLKEMIKTA